MGALESVRLVPVPGPYCTPVRLSYYPEVGMIEDA